MPTLIINRSSEYTNRLRAIKIIVDGKEIDTIKNGETKRFDLPEGDHQVQAKIDWCTSNVVQFRISEGNIKTFNLTSFAKHSRFGIWSAAYYISFAPNKYLRLEEGTVGNG